MGFVKGSLDTLHSIGDGAHQLVLRVAQLLAQFCGAPVRARSLRAAKAALHVGEARECAIDLGHVVREGVARDK